MKNVNLPGYSVLEVIVSTIIILVAFLIFSALVNQLVTTYNSVFDIQIMFNSDAAKTGGPDSLQSQVTTVQVEHGEFSGEKVIIKNINSKKAYYRYSIKTNDTIFF